MKLNELYNREFDRYAEYNYSITNEQIKETVDNIVKRLESLDFSKGEYQITKFSFRKMWFEVVETRRVINVDLKSCFTYELRWYDSKISYNSVRERFEKEFLSRFEDCISIQLVDWDGIYRIEFKV